MHQALVLGSYMPMKATQGAPLHAGSPALIFVSMLSCYGIAGG
jgi:hypothetical protein